MFLVLSGRSVLQGFLGSGGDRCGSHRGLHLRALHLAVHGSAGHDLREGTVLHGYGDVAVGQISHGLQEGQIHLRGVHRDVLTADEID